MTIVNLAVWETSPGRLDELPTAVTTARRIHERLGARVAVWQPVVGGPPARITFTTEFDDLAAWGEFAARLETDAEWRSFWDGATGTTDPLVTVIDSALVSEIEAD